MFEKRLSPSQPLRRRRKKLKVEVLSDDEMDLLCSTTAFSRSQDSLDDLMESGGSSSEDDYVPKVKAESGGNRRKRRRKLKDKEEKAAQVKVATKAEVISLATDAPPEGEPQNSLVGVDEAVLGRIKKALALGTHEGTGEAEAKAAMRLAAKLMAQHNVNQADLLASEKDEDRLKRAGQSTVTIRSTTGNSVILHTWSRIVSSAVTLFFDCESYSEAMGDRVDRTFYGIAEHTVAAAYAFEMVYNLVLMWSAQNKAAKGRTQKNNYCYGVADGLYELAEKEKEGDVRGRTFFDPKAWTPDHDRMPIATQQELLSPISTDHR